MSISDSMRTVFIESFNLYLQEREFNYLNYGKYPYRDRKNSVQIVADFNANAYSVNGLFVTESSYLEVYPPQIIETIETVLLEAEFIYIQSLNFDGETSDPELISEYYKYGTVFNREVVEQEAVEVQTLSYVFPFECVPDSMGRLRLSF